MAFALKDLLVFLATALCAVEGVDHPTSSVAITYHGPAATQSPSPPTPSDPNYPRFAPSCAYKSNKTWCLEDEEYPASEIQAALAYHFPSVVSLYADVADISTHHSVERPNTLEEETYLCPSDTAYVRPLRALSTSGWKIIVNNVKANYQDFTQTTRLEECTTSDEACPLVPYCYESKCLQKSIYHRFLVYTPDEYFPFQISTFRLPASCACFIGEYNYGH